MMTILKYLFVSIHLLNKHNVLINNPGKYIFIGTRNNMFFFITYPVADPENLFRKSQYYVAAWTHS